MIKITLKMIFSNKKMSFSIRAAQNLSKSHHFPSNQAVTNTPTLKVRCAFVYLSVSVYVLGRRNEFSEKLEFQN